MTRKKRAPRKIPVEPELAAALDEHRAMMLADPAPGLEEGWMFPSSAGTLRVPSSLYKAWRRCMEVTGIERRFTVHGMRYTFTDLVRRANVDAVVGEHSRAMSRSGCIGITRTSATTKSELLSPGYSASSRPLRAKFHRCQWGPWWGPPANTVPVSTKAAWLREPSGLDPSSGTRGLLLDGAAARERERVI